MRALLLLLAAAASAEWVEWPAGQAVPEGASTRININTNKVEVDVDINATLLEHRYRTSVNEATRLEDTTANLTRRETMISALKRLPEEEVGDVDALTDDELDALWADRQESLRKWSEQLSDAAKSLQMRLAALLRDDEKAKLEALDELDFELADLDNARDFHDALGGWPALAGLLSADAPEVRRRAAQCVGTAAKHGFQAWVLEHEVLPRLVAMLDEATWPPRKAAVYALGCALRSSAPVQRAFGRRGMAALSKVASTALEDPAGWAVADKVAALIGDLVQEGRAVPPDACDAVAAVLAKAPATGRADRPLRAVLAAVPHCGAGWRARNAVDVSGLRDAFPGDEYGRGLVQLCDDVTEAIRTAEEPPAPPKEPLADLELLPPKLIERLAAAAGRGREL